MLPKLNIFFVFFHYFEFFSTDEDSSESKRFAFKNLYYVLLKTFTNDVYIVYGIVFCAEVLYVYVLFIVLCCVSRKVVCMYFLLRYAVDS